MSKTLVTGAAGFLGSHMVARLRAEGREVVGIDNLSTGKPDNLRSFPDGGGFVFIGCDVTNPQLLSMRELTDVTEIYHLASPASPKFYQAHPFETIEVNTTGTKLMLELARRNGAKLVYSSTSEAYGDPLVHPQDESYRGNVNTWGPRACYDEAKRLGEVYCYEYFRRYGVRVKVARIFNTYSAGLRNDDGRVISNFVTQAIEGADLTVYGDGSQTRSFCYVDDTIRGLRLLMEKSVADGEIVNIGNPVEHTILHVAHTVIRLSGTSGGIRYLPLPEDDPKVRRPVITKAETLLGWRPEVTLEEGLGRTIRAYRERMGGGTRS
ncbi:NAD-dependent epimerase/dehydratase family protein [Paenibacillus mesophilus]|uniref:NAD-dependent epimerase/dehydratase family protein n=1 Tax=Paenibacillus mesophilus TaxID=2582849 RepID=UPI00110E2DF2|nr:NAD-dependent epimerase/dehydratase family protein [Paenibacillus mesophilus]TMV53025.1 NAD-dependent epimerase/dehydratase family protein [Paenibacillus mesophilus]